MQKRLEKNTMIYPNFIYFKGRKVVLNHFLKRDQLYFTQHFHERYEGLARENLQKELTIL